MSVSHRKPVKTTSRRAASVQVQSQIQWVEVPVLIHGITPEPNPRGHVEEYRALMDGVNGALRRYHEQPLSSHRIDVEWGWESGQSQEDDRYLAGVEQKINSMVGQALDAARDFTLNPLRLAYRPIRGLLLFGAGDLFYYVSADGEKALRTHVFGFIAQKLREIMRGPKAGLSLTLFGHSAGSVIAHDLLFHLFGQKESAAHKSEAASIVGSMDALRGLRKEGRMRLRRLYTFGSPISSLALRANTMVEKVRQGSLLDPADIGLRDSDGLSNPRWVNFWDQDDIASAPVAFLYDNRGGMIEDKYINTGSFFPASHNAYWSSGEMADYIAKTLWDKTSEAA